jgi:CPA2 family monovalent cation:H+ antiporter-2
MPHETTLILTLVAGLGGAFVFGAVAQWLKASPLVGYLLAGIIVGPFTPGYVADQGVASELAEVGVILLMFGVGLHFSLKDLLSVRKIAIPGALAQMTVATVLGLGLATLMGWPLGGGLVFGLALSVASTVVLLRALQERRIVQTERGRIAVGWLIVEDLAMVVALVMLPALAGAMDGGGGGFGWVVPVGLTVLKAAAFVAFMLVVGRRIIPWVLHWVAHTGSRELFRLAVLAIALGVAVGAAMLFGVSFALGAFFAGMVLAESELSQRAAEETLPLRDAFAVLFFVSVGMLFNPTVLLRDPLPLLGVLGIILVGKTLAALVIMRAFKRGKETSFTVSASLAQIGEFSFILAGLGVKLELLPPEGRDLILAGAILSILVNPLIFGLAIRAARKRAPAPDAANDLAATSLSEHTVLVGFGRVGEVVAHGLDTAGAPFVLVEPLDDAVAKAKGAGYPIVAGNAADGRTLAAAGIAKAKRLLVAIPSAFEAGQIVAQARKANPDIEIVARAHSDAETTHLSQHGADAVIMGEREIADRMLGRVANAPPPSPPAAPPEPAPTSDALILDDAQHALLAAFYELAPSPYAVVSRTEAYERAELSGFGAERLTAAWNELVKERCLLESENGAALTKLGLAAAAQGPKRKSPI